MEDVITTKVVGSETRFFNEELDASINASAKHGYNRTDKATWLKLAEIMVMVGNKKSVEFRANNGITADEVNSLYAFVKKQFHIKKNKEKNNVIIRKANKEPLQ